MLYLLASTRFPSRLFTCSCPSPISKVWLLTSTSATMMRMCPVSRGGKTRLYNILVGGDQAKDEVAKKCSENVWEILCTGDLAGDSYLLAMICTDDRSEHERRCVQWETPSMGPAYLIFPLSSLKIRASSMFVLSMCLWLRTLAFPTAARFST